MLTLWGANPQERLAGLRFFLAPSGFAFPLAPSRWGLTHIAAAA